MTRDPRLPASGARLTSTYAICFWIPLFPLRCEEHRRLEWSDKPTALLAPTDLRRIWLASALARRAGVRPGMTVNQAVGLCPSLTLGEPDPVHYDEEFTRLLLALEAASPVIEPAALGRVFVGVDGLERLCGGPAEQLRVVAAVAGQAVGPTYSSRLGWARGKFISWVAATHARPGEPVTVHDDRRAAFLATQPIAVLPIHSDTHHRLWQLGLKTLSDVARLPEAALTSQFGAEGRHAWRLASGVGADPVVGRERPEPIAMALDFPTPVADRGMLCHALDKLIARALDHPRRIGWRVQVVRVRAGLEHGASWMTEVTLKNPSADSRRIAAPLEARLDQAPPTGAVERLTVEFAAFALGTEEFQLFARDAASAARAGRHQALHDAAREIHTRFRRSLLHHIVEVQPWSRIPERRYALIDFEP